MGSIKFIVPPPIGRNCTLLYLPKLWVPLISGSVQFRAAHLKPGFCFHFCAPERLVVCSTWTKFRTGSHCLHFVLKSFLP